EPPSRTSFLKKVTVKAFVSETDRKDLHGEWMGVLYASEKGAATIKAHVKSLELEQPERLAKMKLPDLLGDLLSKSVEIRALYATGTWLDIDSVDDVVAGANFCPTVVADPTRAVYDTFGVDTSLRIM